MLGERFRRPICFGLESDPRIGRPGTFRVGHPCAVTRLPRFELRVTGVRAVAQQNHVAWIHRGYRLLVRPRRFLRSGVRVLALKGGEGIFYP